MNVFVLSTGRSGTMGFIRACQHFTNYSANHESLTSRYGYDRFSYPPNHIEADNRLAWVLGRLDKHYGNEAFYVHLQRNPEKVALSYFNKRKRFRTMSRAYHEGILMRKDFINYESCLDMVETIDSNIDLFLKDKEHKMKFPLEESEQYFPEFASRINGKIELSDAMAEFKLKHNATKGYSIIRRTYKELGMFIKYKILNYPQY